MLKTSQALSNDDKAFRIEKKMVYDELNYDIIWQANGEEESIAILVDKVQLEQLRDDIDKILIS